MAYNGPYTSSKDARVEYKIFITKILLNGECFSFIETAPTIV